ncbi:hypothetical protein JCM19235_1947 [Vibrio maritimus]|uniref:Uncharacterized protein n=1 Tax=Vibrio maritimus TaxID=990268 RepID=A0A090RWF8_9VIBR|nr:hypothetical protein JCM19235_1947 [Vibrio maritimus]
MPGLVLLHPTDAEKLDLDSIQDGDFRASNPRAYNAPVIWGLPIVKSRQVPQLLLPT